MAESRQADLNARLLLTCFWGTVLFVSNNQNLGITSEHRAEGVLSQQSLLHCAEKTLVTQVRKISLREFSQSLMQEVIQSWPEPGAKAFNSERSLFPLDSGSCSPPLLAICENTVDLVNSHTHPELELLAQQPRACFSLQRLCLFGL